MKKNRLTDSEVRLLLLFLAVLMFAGAYFLSFQKNVARAQEIEAQNEEDRTYVQMLESMVERRAAVEAETEEYRRAIADIVAKYPPDVPTEKAISIIQDLENRSGVSLSSISFSMDNLVVELTGIVAMEEVEGQVVSSNMSSIGYRNTLGMTYQAKYADFKKMISYINEMSDRTTIPSITAAYDSGTGNISGVITISMYYLTGTGKEYEMPIVGSINKGVSDIFRSGSAAVGQTEDYEGDNEE